MWDLKKVKNRKAELKKQVLQIQGAIAILEEMEKEYNKKEKENVSNEV
tara:strand:- start:382 stop:525 length:144 start_codon:yes stop_codon:yes gene_type:complete